MKKIAVILWVVALTVYLVQTGFCQTELEQNLTVVDNLPWDKKLNRAKLIKQLLVDKDVAKELMLTPEQDVKIQQIATELESLSTDLVVRITREKSQEERKKLFASLSETEQAGYVKFKAVLNASQIERLSIFMRRADLRISKTRELDFLINPKLLEPLKIEEEKLTRLKQIQKRAIEKLKQEKAKYQKKHREIIDSFEGELKSKLSGKERDEFKQLFGKRFDVNQSVKIGNKR